MVVRGSRMYAKIITDIAHQDVDRIYTYGVPEKMEENLFRACAS